MDHAKWPFPKGFAVNCVKLKKELVTAPSLKQIIRSLAAGWSSPVARQAHNLKVTGSNPVPATNFRA